MTPTLAEIVDLIAARDAELAGGREAAIRAIEAAARKVLESDFPRHRHTPLPFREWDIDQYRRMAVHLGRMPPYFDRMGWVATVTDRWNVVVKVGGETPYAAVRAAIDSVKCAKLRNALRAAVEASR